jgi:putative salt-induced outer membrane protein YdiY
VIETPEPLLPQETSPSVEEPSSAPRAELQLPAELTLPLVLAAAGAEAPADAGGASGQQPEEVSWSGTIEAGLQVREGNTDTVDLFGKVKALRKSERQERTALASFDYAESSGKTTRSRVFAEGTYRSYGPARSYFFAVINGEYDEIEDLILRVNAAAGPGRKFIDSENTTLLGEVGAGATVEFYQSRPGTDDEKIEAVLRFHGELVTKVFDRSEFAQALTIYPSMTDFGAFKLVSDTSLTTPLSERLDLRISIHDEYDSDPEVAGVKRNDLTVRATFIYRF